MVIANVHLDTEQPLTTGSPFRRSQQRDTRKPKKGKGASPCVPRYSSIQNLISNLAKSVAFLPLPQKDRDTCLSPHLYW